VADGADFFGGEVVFGGDVERVGREHGGCERDGAIVWKYGACGFDYVCLQSPKST
jgi:hypothetical protein